jgi:hypothetical protein
MMNQRQVISVEEVRSLATTIFDKLAEAGIGTVMIDQTAYWSVFPAEAFSPEEPNLVLSDVADDLADLRAETEKPDSPLSLGLPWHALHHLAGICSAMAAGTLKLPDERQGASARRDAS